MSFCRRKQSVQDALVKLKTGQHKDFDILLNHMSDPSISDDDLKLYLTDLQKSILELGRNCQTLVGVVFSVDWTGRNSQTVKKYQQFVHNLVSAHTFYQKAALKMIVKKFKPTIAAVTESEISTEMRAAHMNVFMHLHKLLQDILNIVPEAQNELAPLLNAAFPYYTTNAYIQQCYVNNLLQVTLYLPKKRVAVLEIIIEKMTKLDARCPRQALQHVDDSDDDIGIFEMDSCDADQLEKSVNKEAETLDILMEHMFLFFRETCYSNGELDWETTKMLYRDLLVVFDKILLPTHASCHVQYLMFYICSFKEQLCEGFIDYLWKKVLNPNLQPIFRKASVAYLASFIARGMFISVGTASAVLDVLVNWVHRYLQQAVDNYCDINRHGTFYSVCQAIFYILAFRHKDLLQTKKGLKYCQGLNLQTVVTSRLNPLKVCLPVVVNTFASIARQHQLAFCETILEKNKRSMLPQVGASSETKCNTPFTNLNPLDSFFPFDPYLLRRSSVFTSPLYREYEGIPVEEDDAEELPEEEHYCDQEQGMEVPCSLPKSPTSPTIDFMMYGSSPGFKHK